MKPFLRSPFSVQPVTPRSCTIAALLLVPLHFFLLPNSAAAEDDYTFECEDDAGAYAGKVLVRNFWQYGLHNIPTTADFTAEFKINDGQYQPAFNVDTNWNMTSRIKMEARGADSGDTVTFKVTAEWTQGMDTNQFIKTMVTTAQ